MRCLILVVSLMIIGLLAVSFSADAELIVVDAEGGGDYEELKDAVDNSSSGDRILVKAGEYTGNIDVTHRLIIEGEDMDTVTVDASYNGSGIIFSSGSSGSRLANITLVGGGSDAFDANLYLSQMDGFLIENVNCSNSLNEGIYIYNAENILIRNTTYWMNNGYSIYAEDNSYNITILNGTARNGSSNAFHFQYSDMIFVNGSYFANNTNYDVYMTYGKIWLANCTFEYNATGGTYVSSGKMVQLNCSIEDDEIWYGSNAKVVINEYLHVKVVRDGSPLEGVDVQVLDEDVEIYATEGYNGTDAQTDSGGFARWIVSRYAEATSDGTIWNATHVKVSYRGWIANRTLNMTNESTAVFEYTGTNTWYVDASNSDPGMNGSESNPFDTIMKAVINASEWDEIIVEEGTYQEDVMFNKTLTVSGSGDKTKIELDTVPYILINSSDVSLTGFKIKDLAVNVTGDHVTLDRVNFVTSGPGLVASGSNLLIETCTFTGNVSINLTDGDDCVISNSELTPEYDGLWITDYTNVVLEESTIAGYYRYGIYATGADLDIINSSISKIAVTITADDPVVAIRGVDSDIMMTNGSITDGSGMALMLNSTNFDVFGAEFNEDDIGVDSGSTLNVGAYLSFYVNKTSGEAIEGADINVTEDGVPVYASKYYDGSDAPTDENGLIEDIMVVNHTYSGSDTPTIVNVTIYAYYAPTAPTAWEEERTTNATESHTEVFTYIPPDINHMPSAEPVTPEDEVSENVEFTITLYDREGDDCKITIQYKVDDGDWENGTLVGGPGSAVDLESSKKGINHTITWDSYTDVPDIDTKSVVVRFNASDDINDNDTYREGNSNQTKSFHLDNDLNQPTIVIDTMPDEYTGNIRVNFTIADPENATCRIEVEYFLNATANFTATKGVGGNTSSSMLADPSGTPYWWQWRSASDVDGLDNNFTLRIRGVDGNGEDPGDWTDVTIHVDNNDLPGLNILSPPSESSGEVEIRFKVSDPESDPCTITVFYKGTADSGFEDAVINASADTEFRSSPGGVTHTVTWDSDVLGTIEDENVQIRVVPRDNDTGPEDTETFHVDNDLNPPSISAINVPTDVYGDVNISFTISDDEEAPCDVYLKYDVDGGSLQTVTMSSDHGNGNVMRNLDATSSGKQFTFTWHTKSDIGKELVEGVTLHLLPEDGGDVSDEGDEETEGPFTVRNDLYIPTIDDISTTGETKNITVEYSITDIDDDLADIRVMYTTDDGDNWNDATMASGGDGDEDLTTGEDGSDHTFIWESYTDLPDQLATVILRIKGSNNLESGVYNLSEKFTVNNVLNVLPEITNLSNDEDYGIIELSFDIRDPDDSHANITIKYGSQNKLATIIEDTGNLTTGSSIKTYTFTWNSTMDLGFVDQSNMKVKVEAHDGTGKSTGNVTFDLMNRHMPRVEIDGVSAVNRRVYINLTLTDSQGDDCNLTIQYTLNGNTWTDAILNETLGESADLVLGSASGEEHEFVWDTKALGLGKTEVKGIRIRAEDGQRNSFWQNFNQDFDAVNPRPDDEEPVVVDNVPGEVSAGDDVVFTVNVTDDSPDVNVTLFWRDGTSGSFTEVDMDKNGNVYTKTITTGSIQEKAVGYYIVIDDGKNIVEIGSEGSPKYVNIEAGSTGGDDGGKTESDPMIFIGVLVIGIVAALVVFIMMKKGKLGGGKKPAEQAPAGQPPMQPAGAPKQQTAPAGAPAHAPMGGAQSANCPVCAAPIIIPPQRPVSVVCNRCQNSFTVK